MKKLMNLKGAQVVSASAQKEVNGGRLLGNCQVGCAGKNRGDNCFHSSGCSCPGQCSSYECIPW